MKIHLKWEKPLRLKDGARQHFIYSCARLNRIPKRPGIYVFARQFDHRYFPLYIGQAQRLQSRITGQLNNLRLMTQLKQAPNGRRFVLIARLVLQRGQQEAKVLKIVESALIKRALAEGHDLFNQQGVKAKVHTISSQGNRSFRDLTLAKMFVEKGKKTD